MGPGLLTYRLRKVIVRLTILSCSSHDCSAYKIVFFLPSPMADQGFAEWDKKIVPRTQSVCVCVCACRALELRRMVVENDCVWVSTCTLPLSVLTPETHTNTIRS